MHPSPMGALPQIDSSSALPGPNQSPRQSRGTWPPAPAPTHSGSLSPLTQHPQSPSGLGLPLSPLLPGRCDKRGHSAGGFAPFPVPRLPVKSGAGHGGSPQQPYDPCLPPARTGHTGTPTPDLARGQPRRPGNHLHSSRTPLFLVESRQLFKDSLPTAARLAPEPALPLPLLKDPPWTWMPGLRTGWVPSAWRAFLCHPFPGRPGAPRNRQTPSIPSTLPTLHAEASHTDSAQRDPIPFSKTTAGPWGTVCLAGQGRGTGPNASGDGLFKHAWPPRRSGALWTPNGGCGGWWFEPAPHGTVWEGLATSSANMKMSHLFKRYEEFQDSESVKANMGPHAPQQPEAGGGSPVWERKRRREGGQSAPGG